MSDVTLQDIPVGWLGAGHVNTLLTTAARLHGSPETLDQSDLQAMLQDSAYATLTTTICAESADRPTCQTDVARFSAALRRWLPDHNKAHFAALERDFDQRLIGLQRAGHALHKSGQAGQALFFWKKFVTAAQLLAAFHGSRITEKIATQLTQPAYRAWQPYFIPLLRQLPPPSVAFASRLARTSTDPALTHYALEHLLAQESAPTLIAAVLHDPTRTLAQRRELATTLAEILAGAPSAAGFQILALLLADTELRGAIHDGLIAWSDQQWSELLQLGNAANNPQLMKNLVQVIPWEAAHDLIAFWHRHVNGQSTEIRAAALGALLAWGRVATNTLLLLRDLEANEPDPTLRTFASQELKSRSVVYYETSYRGTRCTPP